MSSKVKFTDNSAKVIGNINNAIQTAMKSSVMAVEGQVSELARSTEVKKSYTSKVSASGSTTTGTVGSPLMTAIFEEWGTGSFAEKRNGRKGWWVYVEGSTNIPASKKVYTQAQAEAVAASLRKQGLPAHATNGYAPTKALRTGMKVMKPKVEMFLAEALRGMA